MKEKPLETTDALVWAKAFTAQFKGRLLTIDENVMLGWFAAAIEQGRKAAQKQFNDDHYDRF